MTVVALTGLVKIELPDRTLRFCDGGFFNYQGEIYRSEDEVFGTIGSLRTMSESVGNTVPAIMMTLLPPDTTAPIQISQPRNQSSLAQFIIAEYDVETNVISEGSVEFYGQLDQTVLSSSASDYSLAVSVVSLSERFFERNIGNSMNPNWHKYVWPNELGQDNATGLSRSVAWGVESGPGGGGIRGSGNGGNNADTRNQVER